MWRRSDHTVAAASRLRVGDGWSSSILLYSPMAETLLGVFILDSDKNI